MLNFVIGYGCKYDPSMKAAYVTGYKQANKDGSPESIADAIATKGPVSMSLFVNSNFQRYAGEIKSSFDLMKKINVSTIISVWFAKS